VKVEKCRIGGAMLDSCNAECGGVVEVVVEVVVEAMEVQTY
jgi:hypothetical protein